MSPACQWPSNNLFGSSESHDKEDSGGENADGFAAKLTTYGNGTDADSSNQFRTGTNGSRCPSCSGALGWSFAWNGSLAVTFGDKVVTP